MPAVSSLFSIYFAALPAMKLSYLVECKAILACIAFSL